MSLITSLKTAPKERHEARITATLETLCVHAETNGLWDFLKTEIERITECKLVPKPAERQNYMNEAPKTPALIKPIGDIAGGNKK